MVGHAAYPGLQDRNDQPASLSAAVVTTLLRRRLAYRGLVVTDDLEMRAIDQTLDGGAQGLAALRAGSDILMFCRSEERIRQAHAALRRAALEGEIPAARFRESYRRIAAVRRRYLDGRRRARYAPGVLARSRQVFAALAPAPVIAADPTARD
jgi:beta-N-acetylhexosaminidase